MHVTNTPKLLSIWADYRYVASSPDGNKLALSSTDSMIQIIVLSTSEVISTYEGHLVTDGYAPYTLVWFDNHTVMSIGLADNGEMLHRWETETGQPISILEIKNISSWLLKGTYNPLIVWNDQRTQFTGLTDEEMPTIFTIADAVKAMFADA